MFAYHLELAWRSLRRSKMLTALMVIAIGLGIGASMTTLTVFRVLSGDPIPTRSAALFYVQLDAETRANAKPDSEPNRQLTRFDAEALLRGKHAQRQAVGSRGSAPLQAADGPSSGTPIYSDQIRFTSADFFPMFAAPFLFGQAWHESEDSSRARVVVISKGLNDTLFAGANSVGRVLRVAGNDLRIVGVLDIWQPAPRFYDLSSGAYPDPPTEVAFLPYATARDLKLRRVGSIGCWGEVKGDVTDIDAPCAWLQYWVELNSPAAAGEYLDYLNSYSEQQRATGRFDRRANARLRSLIDWLDFNKVVPGDVKLQLWLAFGFLLVCLVNTVGLLLAKCMRQSNEIGIRRALGASRLDIFLQFVFEAGAIGVVGGALGLALTTVGLWVIRQNPASYARLAQIDAAMLATTMLAAIAASLLAGLLPAWRACAVAPALQLKSQ
jgi:putative ABC transport system permease protein